LCSFPKLDVADVSQVDQLVFIVAAYDEELEFADVIVDYNTTKRILAVASAFQSL
jgi:hypothetical protein